MNNYLYAWFVVGGSNDGANYFWSTPPGIISISVILVASLLTIFKEKPDTITCLYNWALALICTIAFLHIEENSNPKHQMMVIVVALAIKKGWDVIKLFRGGSNGS